MILSPGKIGRAKVNSISELAKKFIKKFYAMVVTY